MPLIRLGSLAILSVESQRLNCVLIDMIIETFVDNKTNKSL